MDLPNEILLHILQYVPGKELLSLRQCNSSLNSLCFSSHLWEQKSFLEMETEPKDFRIVCRFYFQKTIQKEDPTKLHLIPIRLYLSLKKLRFCRYGNINRFFPKSLYRAIKEDQIEVMKYLLERGASSSDALTASIQYNRFSIFQYLIQNEMVPYYLGLNLACQLGRVEMVRLLMDRIANINASFIDAAQMGHLEVVELLIDRVTNLHTTISAALHCAAGEGHLQMVQYLHRQGGVNVNDAMLAAIKHGHLPIVEYLIQCDYHFEISHVMHAYLHNQPEIFQLILSSILHDPNVPVRQLRQLADRAVDEKRWNYVGYLARFLEKETPNLDLIGGLFDEN